MGGAADLEIHGEHHIGKVGGGQADEHVPKAGEEVAKVLPMR